MAALRLYQPQRSMACLDSSGVLVKQYAETKDIVASARYASAAAAISVQHLGAQPSLPTKEAIDEFIAARS